jgi:methanobactin biosynthesis MbnP-like protein
MSAMKVQLRAVLWAGAAAWAGALGCSAGAQNDGGSKGGAAGAFSDQGGGGGLRAGSAAAEGGAAPGGSGGSVAPADSACLENATPQRTQGTRLSFSLRPVMNQKPFVFGQPNLLADGRSVVPLNFRFYISEVELLGSDGERPLAVDIVTEQDVPVPYGVHLFNAENEDTSTFAVLAPPGQYTGLRFALGIKLGCNQQPQEGLSEPLTTTSQMTWPHTGGFLFLRYEGRYADSGDSSTSGSGELPPAVHMGGNIMSELVPHVSVAGALAVPGSGTLEVGLKLTMDEVFKGATSDIDVSDVSIGFLSLPEAEAGERLRRELPKLHAFALEP